MPEMAQARLVAADHIEQYGDIERDYSKAPQPDDHVQ